VVAYGSAAAYTVALTGLYFIWYKDNLGLPFHFINDSKYWLQLDKAGHMTTAYTLSNYSYWLLRWSNVPENKSIGYGALMGFGADGLWCHDSHRNTGRLFGRLRCFRI